ncbi:MAG: anthranilate phosphoribosyltransferase [Thermodesulfobacteriota bacterium]|nr:anthranilate phosphoribosyltransferase [Thermodesulfobacteriota bacterium]
MNNILEKLCDGVHLSKDEINSFFSKLMSGNIDASLASSILIALKIKKPSEDEVFHASQFLLDSIDTNESDLRLIDLCGTGGDSKSIINVSTISSLILSALNVKVAKHGNRSVSSKVGSADLFEAIGIDFDKNLDESFESIHKKNISFLFAPYFHKSMKNVIDIRKTLSTRTIFNILGPLINPLRPKCQLLGVYDKELLETMGKVLIKQGVESGMVVHSLDGMDEISICDKTHIFQFNNGEYKNYIFDPQDYGFKFGKIENLMIQDIEESKKILIGILNGSIKDEKRDICILNAGASLYLYDDSMDLDKSFEYIRNKLENKHIFNVLKEYIDLR